MKFSRGRQVNEPRRTLERNTQKQGVYSYYKSSAGSKPLVQPEKTIDLSKLGKTARLLPAIIAALVIIGSLLISLTINSTPSVQTLKGQSSPYRPIEEYAEATAEIMDKNLGNKTKLTIQPDGIEAELISRFPELKAAVLRLPVLGRKPTLVIDIRQPKILLTTQSSSYILDQSGVVVSESRNLSSSDLSGLPVLKDQSGLEISVGKQAVTTDTVDFISSVIAQLNAKDLTVSQLTLPVSANELDININGLNYFVKTDTSGDARLQVGSFLAVKQRLEGEGNLPKEYIDARVNEKVFYK